MTLNPEAGANTGSLEVLEDFHQNYFAQAPYLDAVQAVCEQNPGTSAQACRYLLRAVPYTAFPVVAGQLEINPNDPSELLDAVNARVAVNNDDDVLSVIGNEVTRMVSAAVSEYHGNLSFCCSHARLNRTTALELMRQLVEQLTPQHPLWMQYIRSMSRRYKLDGTLNKSFQNDPVDKWPDPPYEEWKAKALEQWRTAPERIRNLEALTVAIEEAGTFSVIGKSREFGARDLDDA